MTLLRRVACALMVVVAMGLALSATSCGGGTTSPDLVLLGFNLPNIAGVALNQPLIFTFSADIDETSVTPDTLRVVGAVGPFFEEIVADGPLLALIGRSPNFDDYSDAAFARSTTYTVSLPEFPAASTIRTPDGKPLLEADSFSFTTLPTFTFLEPRRPLEHGLPPSLGGRSDDEGCLQNPKNALFSACTPPIVEPPGVDLLPPQPKCLETNPAWCNVQAGSCPGARLLCLVNDGKPRILVRSDGVPPGPNENTTVPSHNQLNVGTASAVRAGFVDLPALRVRTNEPLDPLTVTPLPTTGLGVNVQLWRVGDTDKIPLPGGPEQVRTNQPVTVQSLTQSEIILVASQSVLQGTYLINIKPSVKDLPGNTLHPDTGEPNAAATGYGAIEASIAGKVPVGFRIYFVTLELPNAPQAFSENFGNNLNEWGDLLSAATEQGVFTKTIPDPTNNPNDFILGGAIPTSPNLTLVNAVTGIGQSTTANWNNGFRFLNLSGVDANPDADDGLGRLKAVTTPHCGDGSDGTVDTSISGPGDAIPFDTNTGSANGDGIFEFESFHLGVGDTATVVGSNPLIILCRGDFIVDGTFDLTGEDGDPGFDTDETSVYTNPGALKPYGDGGAGGPGGGAGGDGADPRGVDNGGGAGVEGFRGRSPEFLGNTPENFMAVGGGATQNGGDGGDGSNDGGGGGGYIAAGSEGFDAAGTGAGNGGLPFGDPFFTTVLADFQPDRAYNPNVKIMGGMGGGGGGAEDDNGASETGDGFTGVGDDGGGGGGGAGGGLLVIACGEVTVSGSGAILADGGAGGDTYNRANQLILPGPDGTPGNSDDVFVGPIAAPVPSGDGGPGAGGSGGGVCLVSRVFVTVNGTISCSGGAGGASGDPDRDGGAGGGGALILGVPVFGASDISGATLNAASGFAVVWNPTVNLASAGQTTWFDLVTPTADFNPDLSVPPDGTGDSPPFFVANFLNPVSSVDLDDPLPLGGGQVKGVDFDAFLEMQGATTVAFPPGGGMPSSATGLTQWVDVLVNPTNINAIDGKQFVRWRWRFFVKDGYPGQGPAALAMPGVTDTVIPFKR